MATRFLVERLPQELARWFPLDKAGAIEPVVFAACGYLALVLCWKLLEGPFARTFMRIHYLLLSLGSLVMFLGVVYSAFRAANAPTAPTTRALTSKFLIPFDLMCVPREPASATMDAGILFWLNIFHKSKYVEFIDTIIILSQNRPLTFLHYFHHALVLLQSWTWMEGQLVFTWIGAAFNSFVHIVMYYFYYVGASGGRVSWRSRITQLQIVQFLCSFVVLVLFFQVHWDAEVQKLFKGCKGGDDYVLFSIFFNGALLLLFIRLALAGGSGSKKGGSVKSD